MSNVTEVTPYKKRENHGSSVAGEATSPAIAAAATACMVVVAGACIIGTAKGTIRVARWLAKETETDREVLALVRAERRREITRLEPVAVHLHAESPSALMQTAERLGFHVENAALAAEPMEFAPVLLQGPAGERIALTYNEHGLVVALTQDDTTAVERIVHENLVDKALAHLTRKDLRVTKQTLANGEIRITAHESDDGGHPDGAARISARIRTDGTVKLDIDQVVGDRCSVIAREFANAVDGAVAEEKRKDEYFRLPADVVGAVKKRVGGS